MLVGLKKRKEEKAGNYVYLLVDDLERNSRIFDQQETSAYRLALNVKEAIHFQHFVLLHSKN
jgi:hypothetical protein